MMVARLVLIGFSGTGKSTIGRLVASQIKWELLDVDAEVERREGTSIPDLFRTKGEATFRALERQVLLQGLERRNIVIATGGGAVCTEDVWQVLHGNPSTLVIGFDAEPNTILERLKEQAAEPPGVHTTQRPLLDSDDPLSRIVNMKTERAGYYGRAHVTIPVGRRKAESTAADVAELIALARGDASEITLEVPRAVSRIFVGSGVREKAPDLVTERWPSTKRVWIAADEAVHSHHGEWLSLWSQHLDANTSVHCVPSGEATKTVEGISRLYDWMIGGGVERGDVAVAAGGGVTGDVVGFAAATVLRGIGFVQVPTTLLSMVDASVGGKTGINHPGGKNLIGAFYQPSVVIVDPVFLRTLPARELRSGFAEIIKHGFIQPTTPDGEDAFLLDVLERNTSSLLRLEEPITSWVIRQNISIKASVVREDEKESQLRAILNFGHTIGHGVEASDYSLLHGEAVAVGMVGAMTIAVEKGLVPNEDRMRLTRLLQAYELPVAAEFDAVVVRQKMLRDKKKANGKQQWVLPRQGGGIEMRTDVTDVEIERALAAISRRERLH